MLCTEERERERDERVHVLKWVNTCTTYTRDGSRERGRYLMATLEREKNGRLRKANLYTCTCIPRYKENAKPMVNFLFFLHFFNTRRTSTTEHLVS